MSGKKEAEHLSLWRVRKNILKGHNTFKVHCKGCLKERKVVLSVEKVKAESLVNIELHRNIGNNTGIGTKARTRKWE